MPDRTPAQPDIPPENSKRASIDSATGGVHGSGIGTGGGDFDSDSAAGSGAVPSTPPPPD